MMPALVLINTGRRRLVHLSMKKRVTVGTDGDPDILINHPYFLSNPCTLGQASRSKNAARAGLRLLEISRLSTDGLSVRMIRPALMPGLFVLLLLFGIPAFLFLAKDPTQQEKQDWTDVPLPAHGVFGNCRQDDLHGEGVRFIFSAGEIGAQTLVFTPGGKGGGDALAIYINEWKVPTTTSLPSGWGAEVSLPLPAERINKGANRIEIRPVPRHGEDMIWGVRNVRILPGSDDASGGYRLMETIVLVRTALQEQPLKGPDLARYYEIITGIHTPVDQELSMQKDSLLKEIEERMAEQLRMEVLQARSVAMFEDNEAFLKAIARSRLWLPRGWSEGWKILDEASR